MKFSSQIKKSILVFSLTLTAIAGVAQTTTPINNQQNNAVNEKATLVLTPTNFFVSAPVRDLPVCDDLSTFDGFIVPKDGANTSNELSDKRKRKLAHLNSAGRSSTAIDPKMQMNIAPEDTPVSRAPITNFEDVNNTASPPDPSMAVGPNHVVTMQNGLWAVYDKDGNIAPGFPKTLDDPLSGPNHADNAGDPVVMYDREADRWFISQFQLSGNQNLSDNVFLIGISTTPDPTGAYNIYEYELAAGNDYPHYGVWGDSYVTAGNFTGAQKVYTFNRNKMLAGDPTAEIAGFSPANLAVGGFAAPIPVHSEGAGAATGDIKIVYYQDDAFNGVNSDHIGMWNIDMDWTNAASINNSTISGKVQIPTAPFDAAIAGGFANIAQPGTNQRIDAIVGAVMNMSHWYKFPTHESILLNWVVEIQDGTQKSGIRWVELRSLDNGNTWNVYQEGTFTDPAANTVAQKESVFMGCMSMDKQGNIGLGYTKSGTNTFPSLYYTGRKDGDPLGTMTIPEELAVAGTSSVTNNDRYGDYGQGVTDPTDDLTFWVTSEYSGDANFNRSIRVYSYRIGTEFDDDVAVTAILSPVSAENLSAAETVEVTITNFGENTQTNIPVTLSLNGVQLATETVTGPVSTGDSVNYTFTQTVDVATFGEEYTIEVCTNLAADEELTNNCKSAIVEGTYCVGVSSGCGVDGLKRFALGTIAVDDGDTSCNTENAAGIQGYADRTHLVTDLDRAAGMNTHILQAQTGYNPEELRVWVDVDNDGVFETTELLINDSFTTTNSLQPFDLVLPTTISLGEHTLRAKTFDPNGNGDLEDPCGDVQFGETHDYTINIVDSSMGSCTGTVTYSSSWAPNAPTISDNVIIDGTYNTGTSGNIDACSIIVHGTLIIDADSYVNVYNDVEISATGSVIIEHTGSLVQVDDAASATNLGVITVKYTSANLKPRDFMLLGSPMEDDTPIGLDNPIFKKIEFTTSQFTPHPDVQALFPGGSNFVDEDFNDWSYVTGNFVPGKGYYVMPQESLLDGNQTYDLQFENGMINNGIIRYALTYNTPGPDNAANKNASPNYISNPYPSAISAQDFLAANDAITELYFWEHNTTPSTAFPGGNTANYNMQDISVYNGMGFNPASTGSPVGPTAADIMIASGQGFAVKNNGAVTAQNATFNNAMRRTTGNTTLRTPISADRLWIAINNEEYQLGSTTLIGFSDAATAGFDTLYDSHFVGSPVSVFSEIANTEGAFAIQGREAFNETIKVPLGFISQIDTSTTFKISIAELSGYNLTNRAVYLVDHVTGTITDLKESAYQFTSEKGIFNSRFTVQFVQEGILNNGDISLNNITIYPNPASDFIQISSPDSEMLHIEIFDLRGRKVMASQPKSQQTKIDVNLIPSAMYFVTVKTTEGTITKKFIKK